MSQENLQLHDGQNDLEVNTNILNTDNNERETQLILTNEEGQKLEFWLSPEQRDLLINVLN